MMKYNTAVKINNIDIYDIIYVCINILILWYEWQSDIMLNEKESPKSRNSTW